MHSLAEQHLFPTLQMGLFGGKKAVAVAEGEASSAVATVKDSHDLRVLYDPDDANVDVVALHGLGGGNESTWVSGSRNWLRDADMLPAYLPRARIMAYGYNANVALNTHQGDLRDQAQMFLNRLDQSRDTESKAQRPIIFIGHSLGGIVIKRAMIIAYEDPLYGNISNSARAILFMGTPHRGSSKATLGMLFAHIASAVINPSKELLRTLEKDSKVLQDVTFSWKNRYPSLQVASCHELKKTYLKFERISAQIVDRVSALLEYPGEQQVPMDADHLSICKFTGPEDSRFTLVAPILKRMAQRAVDGNVEPNIQSGRLPSVPRDQGIQQEAVVSEAVPQTPQLLLPAGEPTQLEAEFAAGQEVLYTNGGGTQRLTVANVQNTGLRNEEYQLVADDGTSFLNGRWVSFNELRRL